MLYDPPSNDQGISGVFDSDADFISVVRIIDLIDENAVIYCLY